MRVTFIDDVSPGSRYAARQVAFSSGMRSARVQGASCRTPITSLILRRYPAHHR
jgi:hypothetical protein